MTRVQTIRTSIKSIVNNWSTIKALATGQIAMEITNDPSLAKLIKDVLKVSGFKGPFGQDILLKRALLWYVSSKLPHVDIIEKDSGRVVVDGDEAYRLGVFEPNLYARVDGRNYDPGTGQVIDDDLFQEASQSQRKWHVIDRLFREAFPSTSRATPKANS
jgi:hypothetical protein